MHYPSDLKMLLVNASSVANSAEVLFAAANQAKSQSEQLTANTLIGSGILCAFGIELLLKSIHSLINADNGFHSGHDLKQLFDQIPNQAVRDGISDGFRTQATKELDDFLNAHKSAFQDWRYFCENQATLDFDMKSARILTAILNAKIQELNT